MQATVLFADVSGTTRLFELAGEALALKALAQCLERLSKAAESAGGKVIRTLGDKVMVLFPSPDAAALAAAAMHATIDVLPAVGDLKLGVHVGFHSGPVIEYNRDVLGDTVKLAARLLEEAQKGQTLTSQHTAALLGGGFRGVTSQKSIPLKESGHDVEVCEVLAGDQRRTSGAARQATVVHGTVVHLRCRDQLLTVSRELESIVIGRERGCGLVVGDPMASRRHCTVELHEDRFVLRDHSSNGTLVSIHGQRDLLLRAKELVLRDYGSIAFGPQRFGDSDVLQFRCVQDP